MTATIADAAQQLQTGIAQHQANPVANTPANLCSGSDEQEWLALHCCSKTPRRRHRLRATMRLITLVGDRSGHDRRDAVNVRKIERELGWRPSESFGLERAVRWYLDAAWVRRVQSEV